MANMVSFLGNIGKSVAYSTVDYIKEANPTITSFAEQNAEFGKALYAGIKDYKKTIKNTKKTIKDNDYYIATVNLKNNIFEDLKSGKLYNRERIEKTSNEAINSFFADDDDPFAGFDLDDDSSDISFGDDDTESNAFMADRINAVGQEITNGISLATIKSAEYMTETNIQNTSRVIDNIHVIGSQMTNGFGTVNSTISNLVTFNDKVMKVHVENSAKFYETMTNLQTENNSILKQILEINKQSMGNVTSKKSTSKRTNYDDITNADGMPDLSLYVKSIKENITDMTSSITDMMETFGTGKSNLIHQMTASPLKFVTDGLVKKIIPDIVKKSMESFNSSLSGLFGSAMLKLNDMAENSTNAIGSLIGKVFGVKNDLTKDLSTNKFKKGPVPWDGEARKTLFNISDQLGKIISIMSGEEQKLFDMDTGKYRSKTELQNEYDNLLKSSIRGASYDFRDEFEEILETIKFNKKAERETIREELNNMLESNFTQGKFFNPRKFNSSNAYDYGIYDTEAAKILQGIFNNMSKSSINSLNAGVMAGRQSHTNMINRKNEEGGVLTSINNGIFDSKGSKKGGISALDIMSKKDNLNHDIFYYLQNMTKELVIIRGELQSGNTNYTGRGKRRGYNRKGRIVNTNRTTNSRAAASIDDYKVESFITNNKSTSNGYNIYDNDARFREAESEVDNEQGYLLADANQLLGMEDDDISNAIGRAYDKSKNKELKNIKSNKNKTIMDKLFEAGSFGEKMKVFNDGLTDLLAKPAKFMATMISRADNRLFDLLYGTKDEKDPDKRSFAKRLFGGLTDMFDKFSGWLDENIFSKAKENLTKENIHNAASKVADTLGFDLDGSIDIFKAKMFGKKGTDGKRTGGLLGDTMQGVKDDFKGVGKEVKRYFSEIKDEIYDGLGVEQIDKQARRQSQNQLRYYNRIKNFEQSMELGKPKNIRASRGAKLKNAEFGNLEFTRDEVFQDIINDDNISESTKRRIKGVKNYNKNSDIMHFANGSLYVPKTTVATLSEGEAVIPRELNPFYNGKDTSRKQQLSEEKKVAEEFYKKYGIRLDRNYADGVDSIDPDNISNENKSTADRFKSRINKENAKGFRGQVTQGFSNLINALKAANEQIEFFSGDEEEREKLKENISKAGKEVETNLHAGITGGILGAGASLLTGFGGPLFGALAGSAIGFIKNSETIQKALFGTDDKKGLLPESMAKAIQKYLPDMTKYGVAGGLTTMLPFIPGGPVAGLIVGSTIGFVKNNDEAQDALFGKDGAFKDADKIKKNIQKALPNMSVGAIAGLVGGPFGMVTNVMLGSAVGYATTTESFKDAMFGKVDKITGEREGGVLGSFKTHVVDPMKNFITEGIDSTKTWFKDKVFKPIADAVAPMKKQISLSISNTFGKVYGILSDMFGKSVGAPLNKFMESRVFKPFTSLLKFAIKATTHPIKTAIGVPAGIIGAIGNRYRGKHVASGNADYMTADERIDFRNNARHGLFRRKGLRGDKFAAFDEQMSNMTLTDLQDISGQLGALKNFKGGLDGERNSALNNISDTIYNNQNISYSDAKSIMQSVKKGDFNDVAKKVRRLDLTTLQRDSLFNTIRDEGGKLASVDAMKSDSKTARKELYNKLSEYGFKDINDKNIGKYEKLFNKEISARTPEEELEQKQEERHTTIVDLFEQAISELRKINDPEYKFQMEQEAKQKIHKENSKRKGAFGLDFGYRDVLSDEEIAKRYDDPDYEGSDLETKTDDSNYILGIRRRAGRLASRLLNPMQEKNEYKSKKRYFERRNPGKKYMSFDEFLQSKGHDDEYIEKHGNSKAKDNVTGEDLVNDAVESIENKGDKEYTTDSSGRPLILTKDDKGEMAIDEQNAGNREVLKEQEKEKKTQEDMVEGIKGIGGHIKDWWQKKIHPDNEDEEDHRWKNIFKLLGKIALGTFGGAVAISFLPVLDKWWDNTAKPGIANWWDDRVAPHIAQFIYNHKEGLINTSMKLDQIVTNTRNFIVSIPTALSNFWDMYLHPLMFGDQPWSIKNIFTERLPEYMANGLEFFLEKMVPAVAKGVVTAAPTVVKSLGNMIKSIFNIAIGKDEETKLTTSNIYDENGNIIYKSDRGLFGSSTAADIKKSILAGTVYSNGTGFNGPGSATKAMSTFLGTDAYKMYDDTHGTNYASMENPEYVAYLNELKSKQGKYTSADGRSSSLVGLMTDSVKDHYYDISRGIYEGTNGNYSSSDADFINSINQFAEGSSSSDSSYYTGEKYLLQDGLGNVISWDPSSSSYQSVAYNNMVTGTGTPVVDTTSLYGYGNSYADGISTENNNTYQTDQLIANAYTKGNGIDTTGTTTNSYFDTTNSTSGNVDNSVVNNYYNNTSTGINSETGKAIDNVYGALNGSKLTVSQARQQIITLGSGTYTLGQIIDNDIPLGYYNENGEPLTGQDILYYTDLAEYFGYPDLSAQNAVLQNGKIKRTNKTVGSSVMKVIRNGFRRGLTGQGLGTANLSYKLFSALSNKGLLPKAVSKKWYGGFGLVNGLTRTTSKAVKAGTEGAYAVGNIAGKKVNKFRNFLETVTGTNTQQDIVSEIAKEVSEDVSTKAASETTESVVKSSQQSMIDLMSERVTKDLAKETNEEIVEEVSKKSITGAIKETAEKAGSEAAEKAVQGIAGKTAQAAAKVADANIVTKILNKITDLMKSVINSRPVQAIFGKAIKAVSEKADKFVELIIDGVTKIIQKNKLTMKIAKACGKFLAKLNIILLVADAVAGFTYGVMNANTILGILEQPSWVTRIIIGLVSMLNEVFLCGLLPIDELITLGFNIGVKLGWTSEDSDFSTQRKEAADAVAQYNMDYGTDYTLEDYQNATAKDWYHTVKRSAKNVKNYIFGSSASDTQVSKVYQQFLDNTTSADTIRKILNDSGANISDTEKNAIVTLYNQEHGTSYTSSQFEQIKQLVKSNEEYANAKSYVYKKDNSEVNIIKKIIPGDSDKKEYDSAKSTVQNYELNQMKNGAYNVGGLSAYIGKGTGLYSGTNLDNSGCGPSVMATLLNKIFGTNISTEEIASISQSLGYAKNGGTSADFFTNSLSNLGINTSVASDKKSILNALAGGRAVLLGQDSTNRSKANSPFGKNNHYVLSNGLSSDGKYAYIDDPENPYTTKYSVNNLLKGSNLALSVGSGTGLKNKVTGSNISNEEEKLYQLSDSMQLIINNSSLMKKAINKSLTDAISHIDNIDPDKLFTDTNINFDNGTPDWMKTAFNVLTTITKMPLMIPSLTIYPMKELYKSLSTMVGGITKVSGIRNADSTISSALKGNISAYSTSYWSDEITGSNDNYIYMTARIGNLIKKIVNAPIVMISSILRTLNQNNIADQIANMIRGIENSPSLGNLSATVNQYSPTLSGNGTGLVSQNDNSVAGMKYGNSTIGQSGCGPAVAAMALGDRGVNYSLQDAANFASKNNYINNDGSTDINYFKGIARANGIGSTFTDNKKDILNSIKNGGSTVLVGKDSSNNNKFKSPFGPQSHYVVADGVSNGKVIVRDPELSETRAYDLNAILKGTQGAVDFSSGSFAGRNLTGSGVRNILDVNPTSRTKSKVTEAEVQYARSLYPAQVANIVNADLGAFSPLSATDLNNILASKTTGPFAGQGNIFEAASRASGLNPLYIIAHAASESAWGNSPIAKKKHNYFGIGAFDGSAESSANTFNNMSDGIITGAKWIAANYYNKYGQKTLNSMLYNGGKHEYATDSMWDYIIASIMNGMGVNNYTGYSSNPYSDSMVASGITSYGESVNETDNSFSGILSSLSDVFGLKGHFAKAYGLYTGEVDATSDALNSVGFNSNGTGDDIVATARQYVGKTEYVYGADNMPKEADCSSFTRYVFKKARNVNIGRTTRDQLASTELTTVNSMQPGDIILFSKNGTVKHVGIYSGNNNMIHNSFSKKRVIEVSLLNYNEYSGMKIMAIRRHMGATGVAYVDEAASKIATNNSFNQTTNPTTTDTSKNKSNSSKKKTTTSSSPSLMEKAQYDMFVQLAKKIYGWSDKDAKKYASNIKKDMDSAKKMGMTATEYYAYYEKHKAAIKAKKMTTYQYYEYIKKQTKSKTSKQKVTFTPTKNTTKTINPLEETYNKKYNNTTPNTPSNANKISAYGSGIKKVSMDRMISSTKTTRNTNGGNNTYNSNVRISGKGSGNNVNAQFMLSVVQLLKSINTNTGYLIKLDKITDLISKLNTSGKGSGTSNSKESSSNKINNTRIAAVEAGLKLLLQETISSNNSSIDPSLDQLTNELEALVSE